MSLDFRYTCDEIDQAKADLDGFVEDTLYSMFYERVIDLDDIDRSSEVHDFVAEWKAKLMDDFDNVFERLRDLNAELREAADKQIEDLCDHIDDLKDELRIAEQR